MLETIAKILFALLAIIGLTEVCRLVSFWLLKMKNPGKLYYVVSVGAETEDAEFLLRHGAQRLSWFPGNEEKHLICLDAGMEYRTRLCCALLEKDIPGMVICTKEELAQMFEE